MQQHEALTLNEKLRSLLVECQSEALTSVFGASAASGLTVEKTESTQPSDALNFTHGVKIIFDFGSVIGGLRVNASPSSLAKFLSLSDEIQATDILKELLNQSMGLVKRRLGADDTAGFFLPVVTRQYHDHYFDDSAGSGFLQSTWVYRTDKILMRFQLWVKIIDHQALETMLSEKSLSSTSGVEFL